MARMKQPSRRKRRRVGLPALGAAGMSLMMAGGAAANAPTANVPSLQDTSLRPAITLDEEEIADVSLGTFYVFDKENDSQLGQGIRLAARGGCGGCGRCGGGCAARGCGGGGGRCAVAGCAAARCAVARCAAARCAVARCAGRCGCGGGCGGCGGWWGGCVGVGLGLVGAGCWRWTPAGWVWVCY
jgi:hypothetical protein